MNKEGAMAIPSSWGRFCRPQGGALDDLQESPLFPQHQPLALCQGEVLAGLGIQLQPRPVRLVGRKALERNQAPGDVVRALVRQEIADQLATAAGDDMAPVLGVFAERLALELI